MQLPDCSYGSVLLTGATGVLGAHLLKELLSTTDTDIHCLVRADSIDHARQRLHSFLRVYDPQDKLYGEFLARVKPVLGDVTDVLLGQSQADYDRLAESVDAVIHSAAFTNLFARYSKVEPINVAGTRNMIRFALATPRKQMTYVSTYTIVGDKTFDKNLLFRESDLDIGQGFDHMTYQLSKFTAEKLVREAGEQGLMWKIVRPGQIFGDSTNGLYPQGQTNVSGLFYDIFKTIIESGYAFASETYFDVTPVDYVSRATVFLTLKDRSVFETFHLHNPTSKTYTQTINIIQDLGYPITIVPQTEYKRMLNERELSVGGAEYKSYTTAAFKWWFKRDQFDFAYSCKHDATVAKAALEPRGIRCPKQDHDLLGTYIERGIRNNYFPPALRQASVAAR